MEWPRVTRRNPCPICGKPDWCEFAPEGRRVLCMRVESRWPTKNGGWMHNLSGGSREASNAKALTTGAIKNEVVHTSQPPSHLNCERLLANWRQSQNGQLEPFAA